MKTLITVAVAFLIFSIFLPVLSMFVMGLYGMELSWDEAREWALYATVFALLCNYIREGL